MLLKNGRIYSIHFRKERDLYVNITFWQWIVEFIIDVPISFQFFCIRNWDETVETEPLIIFTLENFGFFMMYVVIPNFYFMADRRFRKVYSQEGYVKAMWKAVTHSF